MINIAALAFTHSNNGNHQLVVYYLINQAKPGRSEFDFIAVFNPNISSVFWQTAAGEICPASATL
jgi:hypothetical protein